METIYNWLDSFLYWTASLTEVELLLFWFGLLAISFLIWYLYEQFYFWFRGYVFDTINKGREERRAKENQTDNFSDSV